MEFRFNSLNIRTKLCVPGVLAHVAPEVWAEMKKYFRGMLTPPPTRTLPPARASLISLTRPKLFPYETVTHFRSRLERLAVKA